MITNVYKSRCFLFFNIYISIVTGTTTITTPLDGKVLGEINITCVVDPQIADVRITLPDGTNAASCTAPLPGIPTNCPRLGPYETFPTKVGTVTTFVLKIPSLDISTHEGNWTCIHVPDKSTGKVYVNAPLFSQGKEPTFTATDTSNSVTFIGEAYCQHPVPAVKFEILYAEENGAFTTLTPQPSISIQNLGSNGCGSQESNVSFSGILSCDDYTLAGKTFTLMAIFTQTNLPTDSNTYNVNSSGSFSCPGPTTEPSGTTTPQQDPACDCPALPCLNGNGFCVLWIIVIVGLMIIITVPIILFIENKRRRKKEKQTKKKSRK